MKNMQRGIGILLLIALFISSHALFAQESTEEPAGAEATPEATAAVVTSEAESTPDVASTPVPESTPPAESTISPETTPEAVDVPLRIVGSGIVNPLVQGVLEASSESFEGEIVTTGTNTGFEQFCNGDAAMVTTNRTITTEEDAACRGSEVEYAQMQVAHDALAFVAHPEDEFLMCLSGQNISDLVAPSSAQTITNWGQVTLLDPNAPAEEEAATPQPEVTPEATEEPEDLPDITVLLPEDGTALYFTLDDAVPGVGFRDDATSADTATILETVRSTPGALGVVTLQTAQDMGDEVMIVPISFSGDPTGCITPSAEAIEDGSYPATTPLYVYYNRAAQDALSPVLNAITDAEVSREAIASAGFTPLTDAGYETNLAILAGEERGTGDEEIERYTVPAQLAGTLTVGGATSGFRLADNAAARLGSGQAAQQGQAAPFTATTNFQGQTLGINEFCTGAMDIVFVNGDGTLTEEQRAACEENRVVPVSFPVGTQAVVLLANADDEFNTCLTREQILTIWGAQTEEEITNWNQISQAMPDLEMTLFSVREGNYLLDLLLSPGDGNPPLPVRLDIEVNGDPLYRAAATANVQGALTFMSWPDYQEVLENEQQNIQLVAVDGGAGCVVPTEDSITSGEYPLTRQTTMLVNQLSLSTVPVQSFLWTMFQENSYNIIRLSGFVGIEEGDLYGIGTDLLNAFAAAEEAAAIAAEATPEVTPEATSEATPEATEATE